MDKKTRSKQKKSKQNRPGENSEANPTDSKTIIKIFDVEDQKTNQPKVVLRGHIDLIHDLSWSQNDQFLVSASADGSAKVWGLDKKNINEEKSKNYTENDDEFFVDQLLHPSFVYAAKIYPDSQMMD